LNVIGNAKTFTVCEKLNTMLGFKLRTLVSFGHFIGVYAYYIYYHDNNIWYQIYRHATVEHTMVWVCKNLVFAISAVTFISFFHGTSPHLIEIDKWEEKTSLKDCVLSNV